MEKLRSKDDSDLTLFVRIALRLFPFVKKKKCCGSYKEGKRCKRCPKRKIFYEQ
jgi:hypothetical protein